MPWLEVLNWIFCGLNLAIYFAFGHLDSLIVGCLNGFTAMNIRTPPQ
jgi:hypothetical protein